MAGDSYIVYRGLYGPVPDRLMPRWRLSRQGLLVRTILWQTRFASWCRDTRREMSAAETAMIDRAQAGLAFQPRRPRRIPPRYRLADVELVPGCTDLVTFIFRSADGRGFSLSQRPSWLPVAEELALARVPFTTVAYRGRPYHIVHGSHGGEPIDNSFWSSTRRSIACDESGVIIELREIVGRGPGLNGLLRLAHDCGVEAAASQAAR